MSLTSHFPLAGIILDSEPEVEATIATLKQHFEVVRQHEVKRLRGRLGQLSSAQKSAIDTLSHCIVDQILHAPVTTLKAASEDTDRLAIIETVHRIFNLDPPLNPGLVVW
jgi:glutamyl-tRNA reductase